MILRSEGTGREDFEILVVGLGFHDDHWFQNAVSGIDAALRGVVGRWPVERSYAVYREVDPPALDAAHAPPTIALDEAALDAYLQDARIAGTPLLERWAPAGRSSISGMVVVVLAAPIGSIAALDAYLPPADGRPPVVVVQQTQTGHLWHNAILRAVGLHHVGLLEELERPGDEYERPPEGWSGVARNILLLSDEQRVALASPNPPPLHQLLGDDAVHWPVQEGVVVPFVPHEGPPSQVSIAGARSTAQDARPSTTFVLHEGARYRTHAVRGAADCLMRRIPGSSVLPVNAPGVGFCPVCRYLAKEHLDAGAAAGPRRQKSLGTQRLEFDDVVWPELEALDGPAVQTWSQRLTGEGQAPHWALTGRVATTAANGAEPGLVLEDVTLTEREEDPFVSSPDVYKRISFTGLAVRFEGAPPWPLDVAGALNAVGDLAPRLTVGRDDGDGEGQLGLKLELHWELSGWIVDAVMSAVFMRMRANVDPGSGVMGCKTYPQLAFRLRRNPAVHASLPRIEGVDGAVRMVMNNVIKPADAEAMAVAMGHDPAHAHHLGMIDTLDASVFTDGNDVHGDADYAAEVSTVPDDAPFNLYGEGPSLSYAWQSRRRLAGLQRFAAPSAFAPIATMVWAGHAQGLAPILPFWSWLFDYAIPQVTPVAGDTESFVGVWEATETTPAGNAASTERRVDLTYPPGHHFADLKDRTPVPQPVLGHVRAARQGAFDNIHITPPMGPDAEQRPIIAAPVCADKCWHLHWRWGADGLKGPDFLISARYRYLGWSHEGRIRNFAVAGAPLIPPNQHLDVRLKRIGPGEMEVEYAVQVKRPGVGHWQVLLEQGTAMAFNYQGFGHIGFALLAQAMLGPTFDTSATNRRLLFPQIYSRLRWFHPVRDGVSSSTVQQIPDLRALPAAQHLALRES